MAAEGVVELGIPGLTGAELIGSGGFAAVYKAEQPAFRRTVAVKLLMVGRMDEATSHRFERECQLMGALSEHPSIVTMFDAGFTPEGRPYLLMAYMPGGSLEDRLAGSGPLPWREAVPICVRMAGALEVAHRAEVVHRDVKPANILLSSFGEPQLTDFGIARVAGGPETSSGVITASMAHAAPEVIDGQRPGVASDVYSLGSTLYALLAGRPAFSRATDESVFPLLLRIRSDPVPDLRGRGIPALVCEAVEAAMAKDPAARPASAQVFGELLRDAEREAGLAPTSMLLGFDAGQPSPAPQTLVLPTPEQPPEPEPVTPPERAPAPPPRRARWPWVAGLGAILAGAVVVAALALSSGDDPPAPETGGGGVDRGALVPGEEVPGRLGAGETHTFRFDGQQGIVAAVEMRTPDPAADPYVAVFGPDGVQVAADDDLGGGVNDLDALAAFVMPAHGSYRVEASNRTGKPAEYVLGVHFEAITLLHPPVDTAGALDFPPDARDVYVFEAPAGARIEVVMISDQPGFDPSLKVYGPAEQLAEDEDSAGGIDGLDARVEFEAPSAGTYRIRAGHTDDVGGRYRLIVNVG